MIQIIGFLIFIIIGIFSCNTAEDFKSSIIGSVIAFMAFVGLVESVIIYSIDVLFFR